MTSLSEGEDVVSMQNRWRRRVCRILYAASLYKESLAERITVSLQSKFE